MLGLGAAYFNDIATLSADRVYDEALSNRASVPNRSVVSRWCSSNHACWAARSRTSVRIAGAGPQAGRRSWFGRASRRDGDRRGPEVSARRSRVRRNPRFRKPGGLRRQWPVHQISWRNCATRETADQRSLALGITLASAVTITSQAGWRSREWHGKLTGGDQGVHALFAARSNHPRQRQEPAHRLAAPGGERPADAGVSRRPGVQLPAVDADRRSTACSTRRTRTAWSSRFDGETARRCGSRSCSRGRARRRAAGRRAASTTGAAAATAAPTGADLRDSRRIPTSALNAETGKPVAGLRRQGRASLHFSENQPLAGRFNDTHRSAWSSATSSS